MITISLMINILTIKLILTIMIFILTIMIIILTIIILFYTNECDSVFLNALFA
jgi:hypothetical protein